MALTAPLRYNSPSEMCGSLCVCGNVQNQIPFEIAWERFCALCILCTVYLREAGMLFVFVAPAKSSLIFSLKE